MGKSKNRFYERDGYMVGVTKIGIEFLFDKSDFEIVSRYTWCMSEAKGNKYIMTRIVKAGKSTTIRLHRLILGSPSQVIDHVNNNCLDNRRSNLRLCSRVENIRNSTKRKAATSRYKGVYYFSSYGRWVAQIQVDGKKKYLGNFGSELEAAVAYNEAAVLYFGQYAHLNKIA